MSAVNAPPVAGSIVSSGSDVSNYYYPMLLSTLAGLSTSIGGAFAVICKPTDSSLAFLLGVAIGVMITVSLVELWLRNAMQHGFPHITLALLAGCVAFYLADLALARLERASHHHHHYTVAPKGASAKAQGGATLHRAGSTNSVTSGEGRGSNEELESASHVVEDAHATLQIRTAAASSLMRVGSPVRRSNSLPGHTLLSVKDVGSDEALWLQEERLAMQPHRLFRLGVLMAVTMTLHNLPEGFAVAFSAFTDVGPLMAVAIAVHNIPEGVIVAAPIYAATGSRWKALAVATASGLSEPAGALVSLWLIRPLLTVQLLDNLLAFVGGVMTAVCVLELWPEARKCRQDRRLFQGIVLGAVIMSWTLFIGV